MEQGWVYVLVNPSIPGLAKIGQTVGLPSHRAIELSRHTGVATPFVLVWEQEFADCAKAEREIHGRLDRRGMRHMQNREFFRGPIPDVIKLICDYAVDTDDYIARARGQSGQELLIQADRYLHGDGDTLQDLDEAIRFYQLAATRGSIVAHERLGAIVAQIHASDRGGRSRAMGYLHEGARRGNYYCYCEIAAVAATEGNVSGFIKAWVQFFAQRQTAFSAEAEQGRDRYLMAVQRYVITCFTLGITPCHLEELTAVAEDLAQSLTRTHRTMHPAHGARRNLTVPLRWVYRALLARPCPSDRARRLMAWLPGRAEVQRASMA